jgi:hypothetical protein
MRIITINNFFIELENKAQTKYGKIEILKTKIWLNVDTGIANLIMV